MLITVSASKSDHGDVVLAEDSPRAALLLRAPASSLGSMVVAD
jgi:hypothetical protein